MIKLRLPKPAATNVVSRHLYLGSVYTKEQMRAFTEKAVKAEREASQRKPLTPAELNALFSNHPDTPHDVNAQEFCRVAMIIEAAHGIKENT